MAEVRLFSTFERLSDLHIKWKNKSIVKGQNILLQKCRDETKIIYIVFIDWGKDFDRFNMECFSTY